MRIVGRHDGDRIDAVVSRALAGEHLVDAP